MSMTEGSLCTTCGNGRNCINGRWCLVLRAYVEYRRAVPCENYIEPTKPTRNKRQ
ncbi:MAG: hypothetical protein K6E73_10600 [Bacteroidales bacterium]|nr:hypothetical protein [Bacteroidales bacterium]